MFLVGDLVVMISEVVVVVVVVVAVVVVFLGQFLEKCPILLQAQHKGFLPSTNTVIVSSRYLIL